MNLEITIVYTDGATHTVTVTPKDSVTFERYFNVPVTRIAEESRMEYMYFLGWAPLTRLGIETRPFDDFLDHIKTIELNSEADDPKEA